MITDVCAFTILLKIDPPLPPKITRSKNNPPKPLISETGHVAKPVWFCIL